jgi:hypothetical protein
MKEIQIFKNEQFGEIRTVEADGKIYFVGNDVAKALGYVRPNDAISAHCRYTAKHRISDNQGIPHNYLVIPEGDVYRLAAKSELSGAEEFESWIFDEVLPNIRKTGSYSTPQASAKLAGHYVHVSGADNNLYLISIFKAFREFLGEEFKGYCFTQLRFIEKWEAANKLFPEDRKKLKNAIIKA